MRLVFPVKFRREDEPDEWLTGSSYDVSAEGMSFETERRHDVSTRLVVLFGVPGEPTARPVAGVVTRSEVSERDRHYLVGVKFVDLDEAGRAHIQAALQRSDVVELLREAAAAGASDVHLAAHHPPLIRVTGQLRPLRAEPIPALTLRHMIYTLMTDRQRQVFERDLELNFSLSIEPTIRFRVNVHSQRSNAEAAFRRIEPSVRTAMDLNLPDIIERFAELHDGLVLVTGAAGAGKTTSVTAMVHYINQTREAVIITLENPIEYVHAYQRSVIKQREIGTDTRSFPIALREALRQDPDVIVVGEIRDEETMQTALDAAETGHLVLATFSSSDCRDAVMRIVHFFRKDRQSQAAMQLANCLRAIVAQRLLPRADQPGLVPATEVVVNTSAVANLIRTQTVEQLDSVMQTGTAHGMQTFAASLERLYAARLISLETYKQQSMNLDQLLRRPI
jgi:twitching motility protein PilT